MIRRIFVEKKPRYSNAKIKNQHIFDNLGITVEDFRYFVRYDIEDISENVFDIAKTAVFCDQVLEVVYDRFPLSRSYQTIVVESVNDAYNNKLSDIYSSLKLLTDVTPRIKVAAVYAIQGVTPSELEKIKDFLINKRFTQEGSMEIPVTLEEEHEEVDDNYSYDGFIKFKDEELNSFITDNNLSLDLEDIQEIQDYFKEQKRDPSRLEIKVLDTYLSDRVRHTTFNTKITKIDIKSENPHIAKAFDIYKDLKEGDTQKAMSLMDIATISKKNQLKIGKLKEVEQSLENHSATVSIDVDNGGKKEKWWISFKNETDNTQTEHEPFSGGATALGGVLRDPISERAYVYQGVRISGNSDPRQRQEDLTGKISPYLISTLSAKGASSQANHFGVPISMVKELYHKNYRAKHLECAFVVGANKKDRVVRGKEAKDDVIVIVGAKTKPEYRIRKGDPLILKKLQRLFVNEEASILIKKAYDVGVGGIACALTEMVDLGVDVNLEFVPTTTDYIKGEDIATSETQDRILVLLKKEDVVRFIALANEENLEAVAIATITSSKRIKMYYDNKCLFDIEKSFFKDNAKVKGKATAIVSDNNAYSFIDKPQQKTMDLFEEGKFKEALLNELNRLQVCSQKGLNEIFDCSLGGGTVLAQYGGKYQLTPTIASVNKIPVDKETTTATAVTYGCIPNLLEKSPFLGAIYSIVLSLSKQAACGVDVDNVYLSLQEYFEKLKDDPVKWGSAVSALLGALYAQEKLGIFAIGGKDSMSGTYGEMGVPPTLISFAVGIVNANKVITNVFEYYKDNEQLNNIYQIPLKRDKYGVPDFKYLKKLYKAINKAIITGGIKACNVVEEGGVASAVFKSCMGNKLGTTWEEIFEDSYSPQFGDFVIQGEDLSELAEFDIKLIATINGTHTAELCGDEFKMNDAEDAYVDALEEVYPTKYKEFGNAGNLICCAKNMFAAPKGIKPTVVVPIVEGTLTDKEIVRGFEQAGAIVKPIKIKTLTHDDVLESIDELANQIEKAQIIAVPDGVRNLSTQIAILFRNTQIADAVEQLLSKNDGLILGIGSGFKALIDTGLLPYGKILHERPDNSIILGENTIPKHISSIARIRVATNKTPWLMTNRLNEEYLVPISHKEGKVTGTEEAIEDLIKEGLVATQYVDVLGKATLTPPFNPNGSRYAIEGIISPNGRILGKTGSVERMALDLFKNVEGNKHMNIFENGVRYFE